MRERIFGDLFWAQSLKSEFLVILVCLFEFHCLIVKLFSVCCIRTLNFKAFAFPVLVEGSWQASLLSFGSQTERTWMLLEEIRTDAPVESDWISWTKMAMRLQWDCSENCCKSLASDRRDLPVRQPSEEDMLLRAIRWLAVWPINENLSLELVCSRNSATRVIRAALIVPQCNRPFAGALLAVHHHDAPWWCCSRIHGWHYRLWFTVLSLVRCSCTQWPSRSSRECWTLFGEQSFVSNILLILLAR